MNEAPSGKSGYYFPENGEHEWKDFSERLAKALAARSDVVLKSTDVTSFESDEVAGQMLLGPFPMAGVFAAIGWGSK